MGAADGSLQIWSGNSISKSSKVHNGSLNALTIGKQVIVTGSKDATICILDGFTLHKMGQIDCKSLLIDSVRPEV